MKLFGVWALCKAEYDHVDVVAAERVTACAEREPLLLAEMRAEVICFDTGGVLTLCSAYSLC